MPNVTSTIRPPAWLRHGIWLVLLAGFAVRLLAMLRQEIVSVDGTTYIRLARALFGTGPHFETVQPPGYPLLIGIAAALYPADEVRAAQLVALLTGTLLLWPFHALARRFLGPIEALATTAALALTPVMIRMSATTMSESPYLLALLLAALLLVQGRPLGAGLMAGVALLIRPEALIVVAGFALLLVLKGIPRQAGAPTEALAPSGTRWRAALLLAAGFALGGIGPNLVYNRVVTGDWSLSGKGGVNVTSPNFWRRELSVARLEAGPDSAGMTERLGRHAKEVVGHYPRMLLAHSAQIGMALGPAAVVGALVGVAAAPILGAPLLMLPVLPLFPALSDHPRFTLPILPFLWILALLGLHRLSGGDERRRRAGVALLVAGWVVVSLVEFRRLPRNEDGYFPELRAAGLALRGVAPQDAIIFDRKPYSSFYARRTGQTIPLGQYEETIAAMERYGGTYLIVADTVTPIFRPDLAPLLNDSFTMLNDPRLALVYFDERDPLRRVAIYQFVRPGLPPVTEKQRRRAAELLRHVPHDSTRHGLHADLLRRKGDYEGMCRECELMLQAEPENWKAMLNLALGLRLLDRERPRQLELLRRARSLQPGQPEIEAALRPLESEDP